MSYGLTPSEPTIPARMTLPGIQVLAARMIHPITGAVLRLSGKDLLRRETVCEAWGNLTGWRNNSP